MRVRLRSPAKSLIMDLAEQVYFSSACSEYVPKVGETYSMLTQSQKDILKDLKSDDIATVRWEYTSLGNMIHERRARQDRYAARQQ